MRPIPRSSAPCCSSPASRRSSRWRSATLHVAGKEFRAGGYVGGALASVLAEYLNRTGSIILILTLLFLAVILATQFSFGRLFAALAEMARDQMRLDRRVAHAARRAPARAAAAGGAEEAPRSAAEGARKIAQRSAADRRKCRRRSCEARRAGRDAGAADTEAVGTAAMVGAAAAALKAASSRPTPPPAIRRAPPTPPADAAAARAGEGAGGAQAGRLRLPAASRCSTRRRANERSTSAS